MRGMAGAREGAEALAAELRRAGVGEPRVAVVLGSGLGAFADGLEERVELDPKALPHLPESRVPGHAGRVTAGRLGGVPVLVQMGRVHLYEGWSPFEVTRSVRAFGLLGVRTLLLTNAAGGLRPEMRPGSLVVLEDHINLQGESPLFPGEQASGSPYDPGLTDAIESEARKQELEVGRGVYAGVRGPSYETPAEIRALVEMGASAVGMSTVCEATLGACIGMRVGAVSCITNLAAGVGEGELLHEDVVEVGRAASRRLVRLLGAVVGGFGG
ncbi:MAG TPA: purine-nucleoside phosphorylase [Planctomycetes bacterium]|nr:purine-nucleoside phosphorylase [Planctomycetota bacterium]